MHATRGRRWAITFAILGILAASCNHTKNADELAKILGIGADEAKPLLERASRLGVADDVFVRSVRQSASVGDQIASTFATASLDEFIRTTGDDVLVDAMCGVLLDAVVSGQPPEADELVFAFVAAAAERFGEVPGLASAVAGIASDIEQLYTASPSEAQAYARVVFVKYKYC